MAPVSARWRWGARGESDRGLGGSRRVLGILGVREGVAVGGKWWLRVGGAIAAKMPEVSVLATGAFYGRTSREMRG